MYEVSDDAIDLKHGEDKTIVGRRDAEHRTTLNFISTSLSLERAVQICERRSLPREVAYADV